MTSYNKHHRTVKKFLYELYCVGIDVSIETKGLCTKVTCVNDEHLKRFGTIVNEVVSRNPDLETVTPITSVTFDDFMLSWEINA